MAQKTKRNVKRMSTADRRSLLRTQAERKWYELPEWAKNMVVDYIFWVAGFITFMLLPAAALGLVIGFRSLPLEFLGTPATNNDAGLAVVILIIKFTLLALSLRPLYHKHIKGWYYLMGAAAAHFVGSIYLDHGITGTAWVLLVFYLFIQVRRRYQS